MMDTYLTNSQSTDTKIQSNTTYSEIGEVRQAIAEFSQVAVVSYRKEARRCSCRNSHLTGAAPGTRIHSHSRTSIAGDHRQNISSVSPRWCALKRGCSRSRNPLRRAFLPLNLTLSQSDSLRHLGRGLDKTVRMPVGQPHSIPEWPPGAPPPILALEFDAPRTIWPQRIFSRSGRLSSGAESIVLCLCPNIFDPSDRGSNTRSSAGEQKCLWQAGAQSFTDH